jgi:YidC/Oxa1 family membrane protein insertase
VIRVALVPVMVKVTRASATIQNIKPITDPITEKIKEARKDGDMATAQALTKELHQVYKNSGANPFTPVLALLQVSSGCLI